MREIKSAKMGGVYMNRGRINKRPRRGILPLRIIIPLVFLILGVGAAYSLVTVKRTPAPGPEPIIIRPSDMDPSQNDGEYNTVEGGVVEPISLDILIEPINPDPSTGPVADGRQDQFTSGRVAAYKVNSAELKKTVDQYANNRANQCAGEITVVTDDTPLNVRSGPATSNAKLSQVTKGSKQNVLLWARDSGNQSGRWFFFVDEPAKTVKGWVSGDFCDASNVVFAN
jgi:hypothetical protein